MRFLLVAPPKRGIARHEEAIPIGLGYLATTLRNLGHQPDLQDCLINQWGVQELLDYISQSKPDMVGITVYSQALRNVREILERIKIRHPEIITIVGGPHPSAVPEHTLRYLKNADYGIKGEGDIPLKQLMPFLEKGTGKPEDVSGLIWREKESIRWNPGVEYDNLDELGFPAWDLIDPARYFNSPDYKGRMSVIHTSRGCPYGCGFCVKLGRKLRYHSIEKVYEQVKFLHEQYGVLKFAIGDEGFAMNPEYIKNFCRYVIKQGNNFKYISGCGLRLNSIDDEMCELMKQANFETNGRFRY